MSRSFFRYFFAFGIVTVFVVSSVTSFCKFTTRSAKNKSTSDIGVDVKDASLEIHSEDLRAIAEKYADIRTLSEDEISLHDEEVNAVLCNTQLSSSEREERLNRLGVYSVYTQSPSELLYNETTFSVYKPTISYDSGKKEYIITGNGKWKANSNSAYYQPWHDDFGGFYLNGTTKDGNRDAVAISLVQTGGSAEGIELKSGYGYGYSYSDSAFSVKNNYKYTGDDLHGAAYLLQDKIKVYDTSKLFPGVYRSKFNMECFVCVLRYNEKFANYSGMATMSYIHTYSSTSINSISLGVNKAGPSLTVSFSSGNKDIIVYGSGKAIVKKK